MGKVESGRLVAGIVLAVLAGLLAMFSLAGASLFFFPPIFVAFLYAWAGWVPALIAALTTCCSIGFAYGTPAGLVAALALCLPALAPISLLRRRTPFVRSVFLSAAAQLAAVLLAVVIVWLGLRADLIDALLASMRASFETLPPYLLKQFLTLMEQLGFLASTETLSNAERLDQLFQTLNRLLRLSMPSILLNSSLLTGALGYLWADWVCVRRGDEPQPSFVPMHEWRLPANMVIGLPACAVVCLVLDANGFAGADAAYVALLQLIYTLLNVQAAGAISRKLRAAGVPRGRRILMVLVPLLLAQPIMRLIGVYSALFGSQGLISGWFRKRLGDHNDKGDE